MASYPHRDINLYAMTLASYEDADADEEVEAYGSAVRDIWREANGYNRPKA
jgi:hypothetical protein